jgi:hypothetical protein
MKKITENISNVISQNEDCLISFDQFAKFEKTIIELKKNVLLEKPTYDYPMIDTIGILTYSALNSK